MYKSCFENSKAMIGSSMTSTRWIVAMVIVTTRFLLEVQESTGFTYNYLPMTTLSIPLTSSSPPSNQNVAFHGISVHLTQQTSNRKYKNLSPSFPSSYSTSFLEDIHGRRRWRKKSSKNRLVLETSTLGNLDDLSTNRRTFENNVFSFQRIKEAVLVPVLFDNSGSALVKSNFKRLLFALEKCWWCIPMMILMAYPLYSLLVISRFPKMPSWWAIKDVTHLQQMPVLCSGFLGSNLSYFISGSYLLGKRMTIAPHVSNLPALSRQNTKEQVVMKNNPARDIARYYPTLGIMVIASGFISFVYHAFQSLGHLGVAETLCFIDHGVAFSSFCCFLKTCGFPSIRTLGIGIPSMALLLFPGDSYPLIHSIWHATSASATVSWALDGLQRRKEFISSTIQQKRRESQSCHLKY
mmetsp:Transcript_11698/g.21883  ORF Transcript_11698/g.21883 Transcript_11698/m.21883 type:complete len:409 (+) Transcript_11698:170-1396(+)